MIPNLVKPYPQVANSKFHIQQLSHAALPLFLVLHNVKIIVAMHIADKFTKYRNFYRRKCQLSTIIVIDRHTCHTCFLIDNVFRCGASVMH